MTEQEFEEYLRKVNELSADERRMLVDRLSHLDHQHEVFDLIESHFKEQGCCPHCASVTYYRHGFVNDLQRYRCCDCGRTFNALTATPLARLRKREHWLSFLTTLIESRSVRKAATALGVNAKTAFLWRHRFLAWISQDKAECLRGITEADETFFLHSEKGNKRLQRKPRKRGGNAQQRGLSQEQVCVVVARDRYAATTDFIAGRGPISATALDEQLLPVLDADALLVSDANLAYRKFSRDNDITHRSVNLSRDQHVDGAFHIQHVNAYHSRLKGWMQRFHGVATKYLHHYLGWRRALDTQNAISPSLLLSSAMSPFPQLTGT